MDKRTQEQREADHKAAQARQIFSRDIRNPRYAPTPAKPVRALPCDGIRRYSHNGQRGLTYSEAWEAISKENHSTGGKVTPKGFRLLKKLNSQHSRLVKKGGKQ
jgi:hypothetical protein